MLPEGPEGVVMAWVWLSGKLVGLVSAIGYSEQFWRVEVGLGARFLVVAVVGVGVCQPQFWQAWVGGQ